jgi:hypothetical protein
MLREFIDSEGTQWQVWEVNPLLHDRAVRSGKARAFLKVPDSWLCFQSGTDRRRLTPVPAEWEICDIRQLEVLCNEAEAVPTTDGREPR